MCRITGIIDFSDNNSYKSEAIIDSMRDAMCAGGPDDSGRYLYEAAKCRIAFGHRRLSIIDTSAKGHQPMHTDSGNLSICYNGEIYNYREVRQELLIKGYNFNTNSDTEVILNAFTEWGINCLAKFTGMFAFLLLDKTNNRVYAVRDRAGVKPLYYYHADGLILFGSELKSFHFHPGFKKEVNREAIAQYITYGYVPAPHCIFKDTYKIEPGHYLQVNLESGEIKDHAYWSAIHAYQAELNHSPLPEILLETEKILSIACNYRMVADVPVGVFLSGGYDSTLVTALLQKDRSEKLKTFCIGFEEEQFNEAPFAKRVAAHIRTDHTEYICTHKDALDIIPSLPEIYDEPFGDSSAIPTILVSRIARQSVKVALSADAGDEVFGGYEKYSSLIDLDERLNKYTGPFRNFAGKMISALNPEFLFSASHGSTLSKKAEKFSRILRAENMGEMLHRLSVSYTEAQLAHIMCGPVKELKNKFHSVSSFSSDTDNINTMLAVDYITYLPDDILTKVDRATMSVGLEGREPLLDHKLLEWMATIPGKTKFKDNIKKYLLREIVHKYVPKEMMNRKKMGFGVPIALWFRTELKEYFEEYFSDQSLDKHKLFNKKYIQRKKERFFAGDDSLVTELWYFFMFQLWYERWM